MTPETKREIDELLRVAEAIASEPYARPAAAIYDLIKAVNLMWVVIQEKKND